MSNTGEGATPPDPPETTRPQRLQLIFIRHGASTWNGEGRIQGQLDPPLSDAGKQQVERLVNRFQGSEVSAIYSSDLARARETAEPLGKALGLELQLSPELREVALGEWEGLMRDEIVARYPREWERWRTAPSYDVVPGGEGTAAFESRVGQAIETLTARHQAGRVVVVTHGGVIQVALLRIVGRSSNGLFPFTINNTSLTVLQGSPERLAVGRVNDTCHLN